MRVLVRVYKGEQVIAAGLTDKNIEGNPIVTIEGEKNRVEVQVRCSPDFACDTGNRGPVVTAIGMQTVAEGETKEVPLTATDPDSDTVTFALKDNPPFVRLETNPDRIVIAPGFDRQNGVYPDVKLEATDSGTPRLTTTVTFSITVTDVNRAPVVVATETSPAGSERCNSTGGSLSCMLEEGQSFNLALAVSDDADETLTSLTLDPTPIGSSLVVAADKKSAVFSWTTTYDQGSATPTMLRFAARDSKDTEGSVTVPVTVVDINREPVVGLTESQSASPRCGVALPLQCVIGEGSTVTLNVTVTDDSGEGIDTLVLTTPPAVTARTTWTPNPEEGREVGCDGPVEHGLLGLAPPVDRHGGACCAHGLRREEGSCPLRSG